jgi:hypothetical protein
MGSMRVVVDVLLLLRGESVLVPVLGDDPGGVVLVAVRG